MLPLQQLASSEGRGPWIGQARPSVPRGADEFAHNEPDLVVCIDIMDPLELISEAELTKLGDRILERSESVLCTLWQLRLKA